MATMPELKSPVATAIEQHYEAIQCPEDWPVLRCSQIGEPCDRKLWYEFRWTTPIKRHEGRTERLFQTGHREEARMVADLRAIGCEVQDVDPATGEQWRVSFIGGVFKGSTDGRVSNIPGAEKTEHLLECKTHNDKSFQDWRRKGVEQSKPIHFAQMQIYMHGLGLLRALYMAHNKNTDEVETERVKYDPMRANALLVKAERIAFSDTPPERNESFACRWCRHRTACLESAWPRTNCRTCLHAELTRDGEWRCTTLGQALTLEQQKAGCKAHLFLPGLVPGEQIDADEDAQTVTYRLADGSSSVDGPASKPEAA